MNAAELESLLQRAWGSLQRTAQDLARTDNPLVFQVARFEDLDPGAKTYLASLFIRESCPVMGATCANGDLEYFLTNFGREILVVPDEAIYGDRRREHVAYAIEQVAHHGFLRPPAVVARLSC